MIDNGPLDIGKCCWSLSGEGIGEKVYVYPMNLPPVIVLVETKTRKKAPARYRSNWIDKTKAHLRGRR
jgi:hypothetical protein